MQIMHQVKVALLSLKSCILNTQSFGHARNLNFRQTTMQELLKMFNLCADVRFELFSSPVNCIIHHLCWNSIGYEFADGCVRSYEMANAYLTLLDAATEYAA